MKGQMFLLTAAVVVGLLVSLKAYVNLQQISNQKDILEVNLENLVYKNIVNEIEQVIKFSSTDANHITDNAIDFINFTRNATQRQGYEMEGIFVGAKMNTTNQTMNITILNFRGEHDLNFSVRLNTSVVQINSSSLNDFTYWTNNFTFTKGEPYNITVIINNRGYEKNITFETKNNKDTYVAFYDFALSNEVAVHQKTFQQKIKIPK